MNRIEAVANVRFPPLRTLPTPPFVIPAKAGTQFRRLLLGPRFRGDDDLLEMSVFDPLRTSIQGLKHLSMKGVSTVLLAVALAGAAYYYASTPTAPSAKTLKFSSAEPIKDIDRCLTIYGNKVAPDFRRTSAGVDLGGGGVSRFPSPTGSTYRSRSEEIRVTLLSDSGQSELTIRSFTPLRSAQTSILRWCSEKGARIPLDWNCVTNSDPTKSIRCQ